MRPTEHGFVGPLAGELEEYIRFKASMAGMAPPASGSCARSTGIASNTGPCVWSGASWQRWIAHRIDANPGGCRSWFSYIRDFGRWMRLAHDPDAYVLSDQWKAGSPRPTPYLLTDREASPVPGGPRERWSLRRRGRGSLARSSCSWPAAGCAPERSGDSPSGTSTTRPGSIDVVDSKAGRSRRLPVGDEVAAELLECDQRSRERFGDDRPAFFVTSTGNPVSPGMPGVVFRRVWTRAGLEWPQAGKRPRPYDFRHRVRVREHRAVDSRRAWT